MKKKKSQVKKWLPWVGLMLAAAILAGLPMLASSREDSSGVKASIRSEKAENRDIDTVLVGGGQLESNGVYNLKIPENVKIKEFLVGNGDTVQEGDPIARIDSVSVMTAITQVQDTLQELSSQINTADSSASTTSISSKPSGTVKKVYAQVGDSIEDVMLRSGALAVISLDNVMAVKLEAQTALSAGDKVDVTIDSVTVTGRVKSNVGGELTVTVDDNKYAIGTQAAVAEKGGRSIGTGSLYVYNAWTVTAYSGTVSAVNIRENQTVYANQALFSVTESGKSAEYQRAIDKRQKYEALMQELFTMYRSGVICAPCDGIVSGVDINGTYMLSTEEGGFVLSLLADESYPVTIVTQSLSSGTVGSMYYAALQAAQGEELVTGTWAASGLPGGLSLDASSGLIYGTPTAAGTFPISVSFTEDGETYCTAELSLTIEKKPEEQKPQYTGYLAQVTVAGGNVIKVKQTEEGYTISDLNNLPKATADSAAMTAEAIYEGQTVVSGGFAVGDTLWVILDADGKLVKTAKLSGESGGMPGGMGNMGDMDDMSGFGGMVGGFSGGSGGMGSFGGTAEEDDGLYSLDKVTVATVTSQEQMTVSISIDELDITKVYVGQTARITMNAFAGESAEAVVKKIANSGENEGGNSKFTVELELQKSSQMLPGMNATATITMDTAKNVLCVPAAAVYEAEGGYIVYTAYDEKTGTLGNPTPVTTGSADADYVQILSGLSAGTTVFYEIYETETQVPMMPI